MYAHAQTTTSQHPVIHQTSVAPGCVACLWVRSQDGVRLHIQTPLCCMACLCSCVLLASMSVTDLIHGIKVHAPVIGCCKQVHTPLVAIFGFQVCPQACIVVARDRHVSAIWPASLPRPHLRATAVGVPATVVVGHTCRTQPVSLQQTVGKIRRMPINFKQQTTHKPSHQLWGLTPSYPSTCAMLHVAPFFRDWSWRPELCKHVATPAPNKSC